MKSSNNGRKEVPLMAAPGEPNLACDSSLSFEDYKRALGAHAEQLADEEIVKLKRLHEQVADIFIDLWMKEKGRNIL